MNMYQEKILDYYRHPRNRGTIAQADFTSGEYNPSCGDRIEITGTIENGMINQVQFTGTGCVISQAAASLLTERVHGKTIADVMALSDEDMQALIGVSLGPVRLKCVLISLQALHKGLVSYIDKGNEHAQSS